MSTNRTVVLGVSSVNDVPAALAGRTLLPAWEIRGLPGIDVEAFDRLLAARTFNYYALRADAGLGLLDLREVLSRLGNQPAVVTLPAPAPAARASRPTPARSRAKRPAKRKEKEAWLVDVPPPPLAADPPGHWSDEF